MFSICLLLKLAHIEILSESLHICNCTSKFDGALHLTKYIHNKITKEKSSFFLREVHKYN